MTSKNWQYVAKDGNPAKEGEYWVTLIYPWNGNMMASVASRYFEDAKNAGAWKMKDQPDEGLVWSEECGSIDGEYVYAWMPIEEVEISELPEGVEERGFDDED